MFKTPMYLNIGRNSDINSNLRYTLDIVSKTLQFVILLGAQTNILLNCYLS